jgi:hypothetical protein
MWTQVPNPCWPIHTYVQGVSPRGQRDAKPLQALGKMQEMEAVKGSTVAIQRPPRRLVVKLLGGSVDVRDAGGLGLLQGVCLWKCYLTTFWDGYWMYH